MNDLMVTITERDARGLGMGRLTTPYKLPRERWMLNNVVDDMSRGNIRYALVQVAYGIEVWRASIRVEDSLEDRE